MVKIACVHTGVTPSIIQLMENEFKKEIKVPYTSAHYANPDIIAMVRQVGHVTPEVASTLIRTFTLGMDSGAQIILSMCSSVGDVAESAKSLFQKANVQIIRIDELMSREAVKKHKRIGVMATLPTTLDPSCRLVQSCAQQENTQVEVIEILAEGTYRIPQPELEEKLCNIALEHQENVDAIILAQSSMVFCQERIIDSIKKPVYASPGFAARAVASAAEFVVSESLV